jgi:lysophospholipase L1-like esterase
MLRLTFLWSVSTLLTLTVFFAVTEIGFQISAAIRTRSLGSRNSEHNWIVYDEDLVYRPRYLPSAGPKTSTFRVVILGDSLIGGTKQDSMVGRLEAVINRDSKLRPNEWINTGVPGYTNYQELVYLKKFGLPLEPDLVGVVFCLNDVHKFENNLTVVNGRLVPDTSFWNPTPEAANSTKGWLLRLARHSLFLRWLGYKTVLASRAVQMYEASGYDFDYRPDFSTAWQDSKWVMIKDQMTEMAELGKEHHFRLFLVVVPFAEQYRKDYLARDSNYVLKPQRILGALMASLKIPYLDLYPHLDSDCFESDHIHLNEKGKQRAAEKIAEFLRTEKLLPVK